MSSTSGSWEVGGALSVTGALGAAVVNTTGTGTHAGREVFTGETIIGITEAQAADVNKLSLTYDWMYSDGTDVFQTRLCLYDTGTNVFSRGYLVSGTLVWK